MATKTVFIDDDDNNNEMDCYLNDKGKLFICVGLAEDDYLYSGHITLYKEDVSLLIKILSKFEMEMPEAL
jgi:hypothetical protein